MTTISLTVCDTTPRESTVRKLALAAGVALVRWAHRRPAAPTHEQQALRLAARAAAERQRDSVRRYGIAQ
jgi:hypothetical protein